MTRDQWKQINIDTLCETINGTESPEGWEELRASLLTYIERMDRATEVYEMENKGVK